MKRIICIVTAMVVSLVLIGCGGEKPDKTETTGNASGQSNKQQQDAVESEQNFDGKIRIDLPQFGVNDLYIVDASPYTSLDEYENGQVFLLGDEAEDELSGASKQYLALLIEGRIFLDDAFNDDYVCYDGSITLCDIDGDRNDEIILQQMVGAAGGAGAYLSRVFDYRGGKLTEIFSSQDESGIYYDTGYSFKIVKDNRFSISNSHTGYKQEFRLEGRDEEYFSKYWYDEKGKARDVQLMVDSFFEFLPVDIDDDGIYEIKCRQYTAINHHAEWLGNAVTVLKYNNSTNAFEIYSTEFECDEQ